MIVRRYLKISSILRFTWRSNLFFLAVALLAAVLHDSLQMKQVAISMNAVGPLGVALAVFLAFRNRSAYDRWWEARRLWGRLVNDSRNLARQLCTFIEVDNPEERRGACDELRQAVYRHIGYVNALRLHLRGQAESCRDELGAYLQPQELEKIQSSTNVPATLAHNQGIYIAKLNRLGYINDFRHMQLDSTLNRLLEIQGGCERIKNTPVPRQYDYFPQVFLYVYAFYLPFALVSEFGWFTAAISIPISFVFHVLQGAGRVNEDPFENRWTDTPMSTLSRTIEINLREQLGEEDLPPPLPLEDGVAF